MTLLLVGFLCGLLCGGVIAVLVHGLFTVRLLNAIDEELRNRIVM